MSLVRVAWACITASFLLAALAALGVVLALSRQDLGSALQRESSAQAASLQRESRLPDATPASVAAEAQRRAREGGWSLLEITPLPPDRTTPLRLVAATSAVPEWFVHFVRVDAQVARAVTPLGPTAAPFASMHLVTSTEPALALLWRVTWGLMLSSLVSGAVLVGVLAWVVRWAKAPLIGFGEQVRALAEMRFVSVAEPRISEWIGLARALNVLVGRVQAMLAERETRLTDMRQRSEQDAIAGVASRDAFVDHLKQGLADGHIGAVVIVRVHDLVGMNQRVGRERTDDFLLAVATVLRARLYPVDAVGAGALGRLNGADFGIALPVLPAAILTSWLQATADSLHALHEQQIADSPYVAWIGASTVIADERFGDVLSRVDNMVMASEMRQEPFRLGSANQPLERIAVAQWRVMIETALDTGRCELALFPVKARAGGVSHMEAMLRLRGADDALITAAAFIAPAVRTGRIVALDLRAIELAGVEIARRNITVAVKVSSHSIRRPIFLERLRAILGAASFDSSRLWVEVEEIGLVDSREALTALGELLREFRCRLGIAHFGLHFSALPELARMAVDYVKLDGNFCAGVASDPARQAFVRITAQLTASLGIDLIAEGVADAADFALLESLGIAGATGPWVSAQLNPADIPLNA